MPQCVHIVNPQKSTYHILTTARIPHDLQQTTKDRSGAHTTFDAAAASALVELPEYRSDGLLVGLTVLQYLVWVVQSTVLHTASGIAGPTEAVLARKLLDITKAVSGADATGAQLWVP